MAKQKSRKDGKGSVFRTKDGQWIAQIRRYDELIAASRQIRRRARSRDHARELLAELNRTAPAPSAPNSTFSEYMVRWRDESLPLLEIAPSTKAMYNQCLTYYGIPAAGKAPLSKLTPSLCDRWLDSVRNTRKLSRPDPVTGVRERDGDFIAASTARTTYMAALRALDTAVRDDLIKSNPLREISAPKVPQVAVPVTKPEQVEALLKACENRRIEPLVYFVAWTGCRIGEALSLRWSDVDLGAGTATIRRGSLSRDSTKTSRVRDVTLLPEVVQQLQDVQARTRRERLAMGSGWHKSDLVFISVTGRPLDRDNVSHELQRALLVAGVTTKRPWHSLRHGFAHRLIKKGMPLPMVSAMLGHSGVAITVDTYGHVDSRVPVDVLTEALGR